MPFINADRIKETTITIGTGNIALLGAVVGFRAFYPTLSVGDTFKYFIVSTSGTEWEAGLGTVVSATTLARTTVQSSSNANAGVNFSAGLKEVGIGPTAGGETPWNPVTNTLDISVNALNDVAITSPTVNQVLKYSGTEWTNQADAVNVGTVTSVSGAGTVSGLTLTGTVTSSGSLMLGGALLAIPLATGVSGTLPVANGGTGVTTSTGTTNVVLSNSPTLVTPLSNSLSAVPVASGAGNPLTIAAGSGIGTGNGANLILNPGEFATSGTRGIVLIDGLNAGKSKSSGVDNTVFGVGALAAITTGSNNVAIGNSALSSVTTHEQNVAIGTAALALNKQDNNVAIGYAASYFNISGTANVAIGYAALYKGTSAYNVGIGFGALENATSSSGNVAIGYQAGKSNNAITIGSNNTLVGSNAGIGPTFEGSNNCIIIGANAVGNGANTTTIGNSSTTKTYLYGTIAAIPVASGLTASVTAASSSGGILTYTAANTFTVGRTVSVTGLGISSGSDLNISSMTIATASSTQFTVVNATAGVSSGTGTATAGAHTLAVTAGSGVGNCKGGSLILSAGAGAGIGAGGNVETKPGTQGSSGGDGRNYWRTSGSINTRPSGGWTANTSNVVAYSYISASGHNTFNIGPDESNWSTGIATHYYSDTPLSVRHPSESSSFKHIAAFYTSNANKSMILLGTSLTEAHVSAGYGAGSTPIDLVLSSVHSISPWYIENLRLKATGETVVSGFLTAPYVRTTSVTVATLPAAGTAGAGARAFVSDATATTFASIVAGGGANGVPVYSDGTNWRIG